MQPEDNGTYLCELFVASDSVPSMSLGDPVEHEVVVAGIAQLYLLRFYSTKDSAKYHFYVPYMYI